MKVKSDIINWKDEADDLFRTLFETGTEGLLVVDHDGCIILTNPRIEELFGYSKDELVGRKVEKLIPKRYTTHHEHHRKSFQEHPERRPMGHNLDLYGLRRDGSEFPVEVSLNHFKLREHPFTLALITDISSRKKAQEEVLKEKAKAQTYLDLAGTLFVVTDHKNRVTLVNQKACQVLGYKEKEVIGKDWADNFVEESERDTANTTLVNLLRQQQGASMTSEYHVLNKTGEHIPVSWHHIQLNNENGQPSGVLSSGEDISEHRAFQKKLEELNTMLEQRVMERTRELENSQNLYNTIARNFPNGTINVLDRNLCYVFVEGKELYRLGITSQNLIGKKIRDRLPLEDADEIVTNLREVFQGQAKTMEVRRKGNYYVLNAVPLAGSDGTINQILVVENNVTVKRQAEKEMQRTLEKERQLNELKSRFVSMASHEFRTPLATILSSSTLIEKYLERGTDTETLQEKISKHFNRIRSNVNNLTGILNDFLSLEKLEAEKIRIRPTHFSIPELAQEVVEEFRHMARNGQVIRYHNGDGNEEVCLDKQMLRNIMNNLISNAIKYSGDGSAIDLRTRVSGGKLEIQVEDHGIGIPENDKQHMFERFFRANNATNIQGTGLGLNIVKRYTDLMKGNVIFESELNKGTVFTLTFPQILTHEEEDSVD